MDPCIVQTIPLDATPQYMPILNMQRMEGICATVIVLLRCAFLQFKATYLYLLTLPFKPLDSDMLV